MRFRRRSCVTVPVLLALLARVLQAQAQGPPPTPVGMAIDTVLDTTVSDPYRWLEDLHDSAVVSWLHAQNDYTHRVLDAIPGRAALAARIHALSNAGAELSYIQFGGARLFYLKRLPGEDADRLCVRDSLAGAERVLLDPERLHHAGGPSWAIDGYRPSWDGHYIAYGVAPDGTGQTTLHVLDVTSGRTLVDSLDRADVEDVRWRPDGRSFFYTRLPPSGPADPVRLHVLGAPAASDVAVLGRGVTGSVPLAVDDVPYIDTYVGSPWAIGEIDHVYRTRREMTLYVAPLARLGTGTVRWRPLVDVQDGVTFFDVHGDDIYLMTHKGAPRYKVVRTSLRRPDFAHAPVVVPETEAVVRYFGVARDALYVVTLDGALGRLWRLPYGARARTAVTLPFDGDVWSLATPARRGALVLLMSWTHSSLWYNFDPGTGHLTDIGLKDPSPVDFSAITSEEVRVPSWDGTMVPLSIVHGRALARDGTNPTLLEGYGAYGFNILSNFDPTLLAWLERGGVYAFCHMRGGGELGEPWHQAGRGAARANVWRDFVACAEYLVRVKWTSPARLAATGRSAGGEMIAMAVVARPDLFRAAVDRVGGGDLVRGTVGDSSSWPEWGRPRQVLTWDAYHQVRSGIAYPAVLLTAGMNDPRENTWGTAKLTARLQAATSSGRPVLLRVDFAGGHGAIGATASQEEAETTDRYTFLLWQLGVEGFQPAGH